MILTFIIDFWPTYKFHHVFQLDCLPTKGSETILPLIKARQVFFFFLDLSCIDSFLKVTGAKWKQLIWLKSELGPFWVPKENINTYHNNTLKRRIVKTRGFYLTLLQIKHMFSFRICSFIRNAEYDFDETWFYFWSTLIYNVPFNIYSNYRNIDLLQFRFV